MKPFQKQQQHRKNEAYRPPQSTLGTTSSDRVTVFGGHSRGGTYVLRIRVHSQLKVAFGRFKGGRVFTIAPGTFSYVGSALSEKGATTLALRLLRHATRCSGRRSHAIRVELSRRFIELGMLDSRVPTRDKTSRWHVDYLLDSDDVELVSIYAIRSPTRIESALGRLLGGDSETSVISQGLGASDVPGNTHLLRVNADELWWRLLPIRMQSLADTKRPDGLAEAYLRGRQCLCSPSAFAKVSFAKGSSARTAANKLSRQLGVAESQVIKDAKFAAAVNTIIFNCGDKAVDAIFFSRFPQNRKAVEQIARTSDVRQRYRVDGVLDGRFRSVAPQNDDSVFDTVKFAEVTSRLGRAAGQLDKWAPTCRRVRNSDVADVRGVIELCHKAATTLRTLIRNGSRPAAKVPKSITRDMVADTFAAMTVRGQIVGKLKAALKLTVKNVWDSEEMQRRGIVPTQDERDKTLDQIAAILATTTNLKARLDKR